MSNDAIVIGSGPNGLAAAIELSRAGYSVRVYEANDTVGGGVRSAELTLPGFVHDICSAVHPLAAGSPFFSTLPLAEYGLGYINPPAALAHPFDDGTAILLHRSVGLTADALGRDARAYNQLMSPLLESWDHLAEDLLSPAGIPRHPIKLARFGFYAFFAGLAAHSFLSLDMLASAAFGLVMATTGHAIGWPITRGGAQKISDALTSYLRDQGAEVLTGVRIISLDQLPSARIIMCDVTPRQLLKIAGHRFPSAFRNKLRRYRYGTAAFKIDWALRGPVPWKAKECTQAATVHLGCSFEEIYASEKACWRDEFAERPFVIVSQPSLFDPTRAPEGQHTLWGYCHVPNGSSVDMTQLIENQVERFAPGFRDQILSKHVMSPAALERHNSNLVGGDINGGAQDLRQMFTRPTIGLYSTPTKGLYICSSSTPPGGGVHGMCGYNAARAAIQHMGSVKEAK